MQHLAKCLPYQAPQQQAAVAAPDQLLPAAPVLLLLHALLDQLARGNQTSSAACSKEAPQHRPTCQH
jgi:hypothetical protein